MTQPPPPPPLTSVLAATGGVWNLRASRQQLASWTQEVAASFKALFHAIGLYAMFGNKVTAAGPDTASYTNNWHNICALFRALTRIHRVQVAMIQLPCIGVLTTTARGKPVFYGTPDSAAVGRVADVVLCNGLSWAIAYLEPMALPSRSHHFSFDYKAYVQCEVDGVDGYMRLECEEPAMAGLAATVHSIVIRDRPRSPDCLPLPPRLAVHCCF